MIEKMLFRIFDRWGELIFESTNRLDGWNGTYKGKQLDPDVYDYYLQATCIDGNEAIIKGNITLLK
jgi:gliding motility-associated-like protein